MKTSLSLRERFWALDLKSKEVNCTRPMPRDFQLLRSVMISRAKTEFLPSLDSRKRRRSFAMAVWGMFETHTVAKTIIAFSSSTAAWLRVRS